MRDRLRRVTELFVQGSEVELPDGSFLWVQVLNPYERDEAVNDAQAARARLIMAMKQSNTERDKVVGRLLEHGKDSMVADLAQVKADAKLPQVNNELQDDPEWKERLDIIRRTDFDQSAKPPTKEETELLAKINKDYFEELNTRIDAEKDWQISSLGRLSDEELIDEYVDAWLERRASDITNAEYELTELWYATRLCDGVPTEDGVDHDKCDHSIRLFEDRADVRGCAEELQQLLRNALTAVGMSVRDPKDSASRGSSSDSSAPPSEPAESTPSSSTATPETAPGT
jgi:hypothetical protein